MMPVRSTVTSGRGCRCCRSRSPRPRWPNRSAGRLTRRAVKPDDRFISTAPVVVVAAFVGDDGAVLVTLRPHGAHLAWQWEFPGGMIDPSESHAYPLLSTTWPRLDSSP